ncbi:hypothetical protein AWJ20_3415 [Sugiyamaella lignohabitans]|uniref:Dihydroorotate dehydrogenase (quinone), mitochondrial n=1 Tax=Sugiyamaella lignohabitans TaxID=796027 RepID=A0A167FW03_9ASCO|nr:uncharacterized protein AWJ20_3415 [Sugiyamaella lignohabitans]ANB15771.1 hypothetical protein AWJ20_3415 [Sugiyamaella lignohabitans]
MFSRQFVSRFRFHARQSNTPTLKSSIGGKITAIATLAGVAGVAGFYYYKDPNAAIHEYFILPSIRLLFDGETSHKLAIETFKYPFLNPKEKVGWIDEIDPHRQLAVTLFANSPNPKVKPITLRAPIGVAAGLDKNGDAIDTLFNFGFPYVEIGSITPEPQPGNPKPRFFRLEKDQAVINRYGFNSEGQKAVLARLKVRLAQIGGLLDTSIPIVGQPINNSLRPESALAISLGKNKTAEAIDDYIKGVRTLGPYADILVINVSSPNTPGLRNLQAEAELRKLLTTVVEERNKLSQDVLPPILVKVAPDLTEPEVESIAGAVKDSKVDGVIVSNTTVARPQSLKSDKKIVSEVGGLSGKPVKPFSIQALKLMRKHLGDDITIIGCGGISNGEDAVDFARAGADFVQLYTGFAYKGPAIVGDIKKGILRELDGRNWSDIVGKSK